MIGSFREGAESIGGTRGDRHGGIHFVRERRGMVTSDDGAGCPSSAAKRGDIRHADRPCRTDRGYFLGLRSVAVDIAEKLIVHGPVGAQLIMESKADQFARSWYTHCTGTAWTLALPSVCPLHPENPSTQARVPDDAAGLFQSLRPRSCAPQEQGPWRCKISLVGGRVRGVIAPADISRSA